MNISIELYKDDRTGEKMVSIAADNASGEEYRYETSEDVGKAVAWYLWNYYPDIVENPDQDYRD